MTITKSIPTDHLRGLDVHRGDKLRILEVGEGTTLVEIQREELLPAAPTGQVAKWLESARGSVRLKPDETPDDVRMEYYAKKYELNP